MWTNIENIEKNVWVCEQINDGDRCGELAYGHVRRPPDKIEAPRTRSCICLGAIPKLCIEEAKAGPCVGGTMYVRRSKHK